MKFKYHHRKYITNKIIHIFLERRWTKFHSAQIIDVSWLSRVVAFVVLALEVPADSTILLSGRSGNFTAESGDTELDVCGWISADLEFKDDSLPFPEFSLLAAETSDPDASPTISDGWAELSGFSGDSLSLSGRLGERGVDFGKRARRNDELFVSMVFMKRPALLLRLMLNEPRLEESEERRNSKLFMKLRRKLLGSFDDSKNEN